MTLETFVLEGLKVLMILVWSLFSYLIILLLKRHKGKPGNWLFYFLTAMGIYWAAYYFRSLLGIDIGPIHQVYVRGPLIPLGGLLCAWTLMILRRPK